MGMVRTIAVAGLYLALGTVCSAFDVIKTDSGTVAIYFDNEPAPLRGARALITRTQQVPKTSCDDALKWLERIPVDTVRREVVN